MAAKIKELSTLLASNLAVTWGDGTTETVTAKQFTAYSDDKRPPIPQCGNSTDFETKFIKLEYTVGSTTTTIRLFVEAITGQNRVLKYTLNSTSWDARQTMPTMGSTRRGATENVCLFIAGDALHGTDSGGLWIIGDVDTGIYGDGN